jgi:hypothetical protein
MDDEMYKFTIDRVWTHNVKFIPLDGGIPVGVEHVETFYVAELWSQPNPDPNPPVWGGITKVPTVGPKENVIMILIVAMLGYFIYRRVYKRMNG